MIHADSHTSVALASRTERVLPPSGVMPALRKDSLVTPSHVRKSQPMGAREDVSATAAKLVAAACRERSTQKPAERAGHTEARKGSLPKLMATRNFWGVLALLVTLVHRAKGNEYQGCYLEDRKSRWFYFNPGDYDPENINPDICAAKCGYYQKAYVALACGRFCYCADTLPLSSTVSNTYCQSPCTGDSLTKCGGIGYVSVYTASQPITGLSLTKDTQVPIVQTGDAVSFSIGITTGRDVFYQMDYDDGAGLSQKNATGFTTQTFYVPGVYSIRVEANDFNDTLETAKAVTTVTAHAPVSGVDVECDPVFATFDEGVCEVTVWQGTDLNLTAEIPGVLAATFAIADPVLHRVGPGIPTKDSLLSQSHAGTVIAPASLVEWPARVVGWEMGVQTSGTFKVLILSPSCAQYCLEQNTCTTSCPSLGATVYRVSCPAHPFCPRRRLCDSDTGTCTSTNRFAATGPQVSGYTVKQVVSVVATISGYQYIPESSIVSVAPGDILGVDIDGSASARLSWFYVSANLTNFKVTGSHTTGSTISAGVSATGPGDNIALRAVISEGSKVYLPYVFETENVYTLTVTAFNKQLPRPASQTNTTTINVLEGVNCTIIDAPIYTKTNSPVIIIIDPHTGAQARYNWSISDGFVLDYSANQTITHTFTSAGVYNVTATTFNSVSFKTNSTIVVVQDEVQGLALSSLTAASGEVHNLNITLTGGSDYACAWTFGDGTPPQTTNSTSTPVGSTSYQHVFAAVGTYTVTVQCANSVSNLTQTLVQKVQERITGLSLLSAGQDSTQPVIVPWSLANGSDVTWSFEFGGSPKAVDVALSKPTDRKWQSVSMGVFPGGAKPVTITGSNDISNSTLSTNFLLVATIAGASAVASTNKTTTGIIVTYTVSVTKGSDVVVTIDFNDGTIENRSYSNDKGFTDTILHSFYNGGDYVVNVTIANPAGTFPFPLSVLVQQGVSDIQMICEDYALYAPPAYVNVRFELPPNRSAPSRPRARLDFGDGEGLSAEFPLELFKNYTRRFDDTGTFKVFATVYNDLDGKNFSKDLVVLEKLVDAFIVPQFPKAPLNMPMTVKFVLYRGPTGNLANLTWDFQDGKGPSITHRAGSGMNGSDVQTVMYSSLSNQYITITATSPLETLSQTLSIEVIYPVVESQITVSVNPKIADFNSPISFNVTWNGNASQVPPDVTIVIVYGDGQVENKSFNISRAGSAVVFSHVFVTDGTFETNITVSNPASLVQNVTQVGSYKPFTSPTVSACYKPDIPVNEMCRNGVNEDGKQYPLNKPVTLTFNTSNNAQAQYYDVTAVQGYDTVVCRMYTNPFILTNVTKAGDWNISVLAVNPLYNATFQMTMTIVEFVEGFSITHDPSEKRGGSPKRFNISFTSVGTSTCLDIDYGDGHREICTDNIAKCSPPLSFTDCQGNLTGLTYVQHTYMQEKFYTVTAKAFNAVTKATSVVSFDITGLDCSQPQVQIYNATRNFQHPMIFRRGDYANLRGIPIITCAITYSNSKLWTIEKIDPNNGTSLGNADLSSVKLATADLTLGPWLLDWGGLYKATFNMSMNTTDPKFKFMASDYSYFKIVKSDLVGLMVRGGASEIVRGNATGNVLELLPLNNSYDPDVENNDPTLSNITIDSWSCYDTSKLGANVSECQQLTTAAQNGPRRQLVGFPMSNLAVGKVYNVTVTLVKDTRTVSASVNINVVKGDPPQILILCAAGSTCIQQTNGYLVLESERLSLDAQCANCNSDDSLTYSWNISVYDYRWDNSWRPLQPKDLEKGRTVGVASKQFAIEPGLYQTYKPITRFKAECVITRNGVQGWASSVLTLNTPPWGGNCSISPKTARVSSEKIFTINCWGWRDNETSIDLYSFFTTYDSTMVPVQITTVQTTDDRFTVPVSLAQGLSQNNFSNTVNVCVRDTLGAQTCVVIDTVQVNPIPVDEARQMVSMLLTTEHNPLNKVIQEGDSITASLYVNTLASVINSDKFQTQGIPSTQAASGLSNYDSDRTNAFYQPNQVSPAEQTAMEQQRDDRAQLRELAASQILTLPKNNIRVVKEMLSALDGLAKYPDELTSDFQSKVLVGLNDMASVVNTASGATRDEKMQTFSYLLSVAAAVADGAGLSGLYPTNTNKQAAKQTSAFKDYDSENIAPSDDCLLSVQYPTTLEEADSYWSSVASCQLQRQNTIEMERQIAEVRTNVILSFSNNSIPGEAKTFVSDRSITLVNKTEAAKLFGGTQKANNSNADVQFPPLSTVFPNNSLGPNDTVVFAISENAYLPNSYSEGAKNVRDAKSRFVTINIYDNNNNPISVDNLSTPIRVTVPRDPNIPRITAANVDPKLASWNVFQFHKTNISNNDSSLHWEICFNSTKVQLVVVINFAALPDIKNQTCAAAFLVPPSMAVPASSRQLCTKGMLDNKQVNNFKGTAYLGVRQLEDSEQDMNVTDCLALPEWEAGKNETQFTVLYSLKLFTSGCYAKNEASTTSDWSSYGLTVSPETDENQTVCLTTHMTTFAGGWVVVPNTIDWNYVFSNLDFYKNPTLYVTEIVIALVYIIAVVLARRKDKKDVEKLGIAPLVDNDPSDNYYYEIVTVTGMRKNAGTDSKVYFILSGEEDETDVRQFSDSKRKIFRRGDTNGFLMAVPRPLGYLNYARVWHDNSGKGKFGSWYLNYMIVRDVQTDQKWVFIADRWFAVEEDDGQVDRIIPAATHEQMTQFSHVFAERTRRDLADGHLWFSVLARPPQSRFTCVQRVSCCLCLLYATMLANAMFYRTTPKSTESSNGFSVGPFTLTPEQVFIGVVSNLIVFPVNFLIVYLFRKARPRRKRPSRVDEAIKNAHYYHREASVADVKAEVGSIFTMSRGATMVSDTKRPDSAASRPGTSLSARADPSMPTKKKSKSLPWWCRIVAWVVLWVATLLSAAFVTFYGISFSEEICRKWITSLLISFFMSVLVTQPIKVFLMAIFLSIIIRNPGEEEEEEEIDEETTKLANDEIPLHPMNSESYGAARPRRIGYKPPDRRELEEARERRLKEIQMWSVVREVVIYSFFLWILMVISYRTSNSNTYLYKSTMEQVFITSVKTDIDFSSIKNVDDFWNWTQSGLVNGIRAGPYYNDYPPLLLRGYVNDKASKILGYAVIRQLRIQPDLCEIDKRIMAIIRECNVGYDMLTQEEREFDVGWRPLSPNSSIINNTESWYRYASASELNGYPYFGALAVYSGGGYVARLRGSKEDLVNMMQQLQSEKWIDRYTRAVFVEFTTYNAQVNLFGIATILAEFHPTGGAVTSYRLEPAMLLPYMTSAMLFQLVCEGVFCLFILFFAVNLIRTLIKEKKEFFLSFWNLVEMAVVSLSLTAIVIYFYKLVETNKLTARFKETKGLDYIKFQYVGYWNELFTYMVGWTVFFATLKFLRLLRFNRRMSMLASTLRQGRKSLLHFGVIFAIVFLAFSQLFFLNYMTVDIEYSTFVGSIVSGILMMMGKYDIYTLIMAEPIWSQIFVILFVVAVAFILANMFVTILNETFGAVREDLQKQTNDYEIVEFMLSRFKRWTGLATQAPTTLTPEELNQLRHQQYAKEGAVAGGDSNVDNFPNRIDRLLTSISNVYMNDQEGLGALLTNKTFGGNSESTAGKTFLRSAGPPDQTAPPGGARARAGSLAKVHTH